MNLNEFNSLSLHILMLHNRYQYTGGEDTSTQAEISILRDFCHQVTYLEADNDHIKQFSFFDKFQLFFHYCLESSAGHDFEIKTQELKA